LQWHVNRHDLFYFFNDPQNNGIKTDKYCQLKFVFKKIKKKNN